jgi:Ca2+-binding RTX toxin-like protein
MTLATRLPWQVRRVIHRAGARGRAAAKHRATAARPIAERVEPRRLLSAYIQDGTLFLVGTGRDDLLAVNGGTATLTASERDRATNQIRASADFRIADVTNGIRLIGRSGNDSLHVDSTVNLPAFLYGQGGNDDLNGGSGNDELWGGEGNDNLIGGRGGDRFSGGDGSDSAAYTPELNSVVVTIDGTANDGRGGMDGTGFRGEGAAADFMGDDLEVLRGTPDNDRLDAQGATGPVTLYGFGGNDELFGGAYDDRLVGARGGDFLVGRGGRDIADYTAHNGVVVTLDGAYNDGRNGYDGSGPNGAGPAGDNVNTEQVFGGQGDDTLDATAAAGPVTLLGNGGHDLMIGTNANDELYAGVGDDTLIGRGGNDLLDGNSGSDHMLGGDGIDTVTYAYRTEAERVTVGDAGFNDGGPSDEGTLRATQLGYAVRDAVEGTVERVIGGSGKDHLMGNERANILIGGPGDDRLEGGAGNDTLEGGAAGDVLEAGPGDDVLNGGTEDDSGDALYGREGDDRLDGGPGPDWLYGGDNQDTLLGGDGNDIILEGGPGADFLDGGRGVDTVSYAGSVQGPSGVVVTIDDRQDDGVPGESDNVRRTVERVIGSPFADRITGSALANRLEGGSGNDTLRGGAAGDELEGGPGDDLLQGGTEDLSGDALYGREGNDTLEGGPGPDWLEGAAGNDRLYGGTGGDILHGEAGDDELYGGDGDATFHGGDELYGGDGQDTVYGEGGPDLLDGGPGADDLDGGSGIDAVAYAAVEGPRGINVSLDNVANDGVAGPGSTVVEFDNVRSSVENVIGTPFDDIITGSSASNLLVGSGGNDRLAGGDGRDILIGGSGADTLSGGGSDDLLVAGRTTYDANPTDLRALQSEWTSGRSYAARVANLRGAGSGSRSNGSIFLRTRPAPGARQTVFSDTSVDAIAGSTGRDWFLANADTAGSAALGGPADRISDRVTGGASAELLHDLNAT